MPDEIELTPAQDEVLDKAWAELRKEAAKRRAEKQASELLANWTSPEAKELLFDEQAGDGDGSN